MHVNRMVQRQYIVHLRHTDLVARTPSRRIHQDEFRIIPPGDAPQGITSRQSETGEELMVPYERLSEPAKELDRATVRAVYEAIRAAAAAE